jgi:tetratricopeptide (TPR) repeat protein
VGYLGDVVPEPLNIARRHVQARVLLLSFLLLALLFVITAALARAYHAREEGLAAEWSEKGKSDLAMGSPREAFEDFRNALSYGPGNRFVELRLAEALLADERYTEARSYLLALWESAPGSGEVSLDLAHDSLHLGNVNEAIHYFRDAILGSWEQEPALNRRNVRIELCELLLSQGRTSDAQAEIAGLAAETPPGNAPQREEAGRFFLRAGEPDRALDEFEAALRVDSGQSKWLAEAGQAAFQAGDYSRAERYFSRADRQDPSLEVHQSLELVRDVLANDPFYLGLSEEESARRIARDLDQSLARLRTCMASAASSAPSLSALQGLAKDAQDFQKRVSRRSLERNPREQADAIQLIFKIVDGTSKGCGPSMGLDRALELIEKHNQGRTP